MESKLTGDAYLNYWRERIAEGPDEVSFNGEESREQGFQIWSFIEPKLWQFTPQAVLDYGSGYGRMLRRLRMVWPDAWLYGVALCPSAIERSWKDDKTCLFCSHVPVSCAPDLIFTCLVLQHITDEEVFREVVDAFNRDLKPGGHLVMIENISLTQAGHLRDMTADDYMALWPYEWKPLETLVLRGQEHGLLIGRKP